MASRSQSSGARRPEGSRSAGSHRAKPLAAAQPRSATQPPAGLKLLKGSVIGVVGAGQIGGSIVRRLGVLRPAISLGAFDLDSSLAAKLRRFARWCRTLEMLVGQSDVLVLAVPVQRAIAILPRIARLARHRTSRRKLIVCDTSTVKATIAAAAQPHTRAFDFVGLHPLAGTEGQGWDSANAALFEGRPVVVCPAVARANRVARELVALLGGVPVKMEASDHDRFAAEGIGLPHLLAFAAAGTGAREPAGLLPAGALLKGGSWRSLTRVAASSPAMVAGFLHENRDHQLRALARFQRQLDAVARLLRRPTARRLERQLAVWQR